MAAAAGGLLQSRVLSQSGAQATPPVFTAEQAARGKVQYVEHCAACHGANLEGEAMAGALKGERFVNRWAGQNAAA